MAGANRGRHLAASHRGAWAATEAASASDRGARAAASASNRGSRRRTPEAVVQRTSGHGAGGRAPWPVLSLPNLQPARRVEASPWADLNLRAREVGRHSAALTARGELDPA